ncbi:hypothetical protein [Streptomyces sp. NPDC058612]|uniref:hypothetical protein n=1 Tax=Streptomyces sp. NPDC058612 TaxID=3346555 RepID=UPI00366168D4
MSVDLMVIAAIVVGATGLLVWLLALVLAVVALLRGAYCLWQAIRSRAVVARYW